MTVKRFKIIEGISIIAFLLVDNIALFYHPIWIFILMGALLCWIVIFKYLHKCPKCCKDVHYMFLFRKKCPVCGCVLREEDMVQVKKK